MTGTSIINHNPTSSYDKLRVWDSPAYTIGMKAAQTYGWLNDYAMTFTMSNTVNRGFAWRDYSDIASDAAMSLTIDGKLMVKDRLGFTGDTSTYLSRSGAQLRTTSSNGFINMGAANSSWAHFSTDRPNFHFAQGVHVDGTVAVYNTSTYMDSSGMYDNGSRVYSPSNDAVLGKLANAQTWTGINTFNIRTEVQGSGGWAYTRLKNNSSTLWDIASSPVDDSGSLQFRPAGGATNRVTINSSGVVTAPAFSGSLSGTATNADALAGYAGSDYIKRSDTHRSGDVYWDINGRQTTEQIRKTLNTTDGRIIAVDDSSAPEGGCFQVTGYVSVQAADYWKVNVNDTYHFEVWMKFISGTDTAAALYAGWSAFDSAKTYFGNVNRYWGAAYEEIDANTRNDGEWHKVVGRIGAGQFTAGTEYALPLLLLNYNSDATNVIRYCGLKMYRADDRMVSEITQMSTSAKDGSVDTNFVTRLAENGDITARALTATAKSTLSGGVSFGTATGSFSGDANYTTFNGGDYYIQSEVNNCYNYAANNFHGSTSGDNQIFRGNTLTGNNWSLTGAGVFTINRANVGGDSISVIGTANSSWPLRITSNSVGNDNSSGFWVGANGYPDMRLRREDGTVRSLISSWEESYVSNGLRVEGTLKANGGLSQDGHTVLNGSDTWLRTLGATGVYFSSYGGGVYMSDSTYVKTYASKAFRTENTGTNALSAYGGIVLGVGSRYGMGVTGQYSSTKFQGVFSMGSAYQLPADGTTPGNLYGIAWTHSNNTNTNGRRIGGHHACFMTNGVTKSAVGDHIWTSGNVTAYGTSDENLKDSITEISSPLSKVCSLRTSTFNKLDRTTGESTFETGLIAQDVQKTIPELVSENSDGDLVIRHGKNELIALAFAAIKELKQEVDGLRGAS